MCKTFSLYPLHIFLHGRISIEIIIFFSITLSCVFVKNQLLYLCVNGKEFEGNAGDQGFISGSGRFPEKGMAAHANILVWKIPWTEAHQSLWCPEFLLS